MSLIDRLIDPVSTLLDKFIPDADTKAQLAHEIATLAERQSHEIALAQIEVNKTEAQSNSLFKGGWRPLTGWVCATALAYHFILQPVILFFVAMYGWEIPTLPEFDMSTLMTVLMGMLGLGSMRSYEKAKGVAAK